MSNGPDTETQPDQPKPTRLGSLAYVVHTLLEFGRHLADTVVRRSKQPSFASIALGFGTANLPLIMARIERGILRATALARVLAERAAKGGDIAFVRPRYYTTDPLPDPADPKPARAPRQCPSTSHITRARWDDLSSPLTLEEIEAQVRRRPIGRTIVDICLDLGVSTAICERVFGMHLNDAVFFYRGNFNKLGGEHERRWKAFQLERNRGPINGWWEWWDEKIETTRQAFGFLVGEPPTLPPELLPAPT